ncbi:MAG: hypothetical protein KDD69_05410 [Bdellovibrionales bacterium]|nr:hypothetical protein [Bdellovibrionales bacterium]
MHYTETNGWLRPIGQILLNLDCFGRVGFGRAGFGRAGFGWGFRCFTGHRSPAPWFYFGATVALLCNLIAASRATAEVGTPLATYSIAELNDMAPTTGRFRIQGYVLRRFMCPPCPDGARCEPCNGNHVVVSDYRGPLDSSLNARHQAVLFCDDPTKLDRERRYVFEVELLDSHSTASRLKDLRLLSYSN